MANKNDFVESLMKFLVPQGPGGYSNIETKKSIESLFKRLDKEKKLEAKSEIGSLINAITSKGQNSKECVIIKRQGLLKKLTEHFT